MPQTSAFSWYTPFRPYIWNSPLNQPSKFKKSDNSKAKKSLHHKSHQMWSCCMSAPCKSLAPRMLATFVLARSLYLARVSNVWPVTAGFYLLLFIFFKYVCTHVCNSWASTLALSSSGFTAAKHFLLFSFFSRSVYYSCVSMHACNLCACMLTLSGLGFTFSTCLLVPKSIFFSSYAPQGTGCFFNWASP